MKIALRSILFFVAWYVLLELATVYGAIWHLRAHPTEGVRVQFRDGRDVEGALSRDWNRKWVLTRADGSVIDFDLDATSVMTFQKPDSPPGFTHAWRSWLPMSLVSNFFVAILAVYLLRGVQRRRRLPSS